MKSFGDWVNDMANSIEDASVIKKDKYGNIVQEPTGYITCKNCGANALQDIYEDMYYYD